MPANLVRYIIENTELNDCIEHYALCTHDKDNKAEHTHFLVKFYRNESYLTKLVEYFHCDNVSDPSHKLVECFKYLIHDSDKCRKEKKYMYSSEERIVDDLEFWDNISALECNDKDDVMSIVDDIIAGVSEYELGKRYGRDYIIHRRQYQEFVGWVKYQEHCEKSKVSYDEFCSLFSNAKEIDINDLKHINFGGSKNGKNDN